MGKYSGFKVGDRVVPLNNSESNYALTESRGEPGTVTDLTDNGESIMITWDVDNRALAYNVSEFELYQEPVADEPAKGENKIIAIHEDDILDLLALIEEAQEIIRSPESFNANPLRSATIITGALASSRVMFEYIRDIGNSKEDNK